LLISAVFTTTTPDPTSNGEGRKPFTAPGYGHTGGYNRKPHLGCQAAKQLGPHRRYVRLRRPHRGTISAGTQGGFVRTINQAVPLTAQGSGQLQS
jgi:hypothetical protein